jgi:hypothetical protein
MPERSFHSLSQRRTKAKENLSGGASIGDRLRFYSFLKLLKPTSNMVLAIAKRLLFPLLPSNHRLATFSVWSDFVYVSSQYQGACSMLRDAIRTHPRRFAMRSALNNVAGWQFSASGDSRNDCIFTFKTRFWRPLLPLTKRAVAIIPTIFVIRFCGTADDADLKAFATKIAVVVGQHLDQAKQVQTHLKTSTSASR